MQNAQQLRKAYSDFRREVGLTDSQNHGNIIDISRRLLRDHFNFDSAGSTFFLRSLEFIKATAFTVEYADLTFRDVFPVTNEVGSGKVFYTYRVFDHVGQAKVIGNMADDLPRADSFGKEVQNVIRTIGASYAYDIKEMQASTVQGGKPLDQQRADAASRSIQELFNKIAYFGEPDYGLQGLFNNTLIPRASVAQGASLSTLWNTKTPDEIVADVNALFSSINENSLMVESADSLLLPVAQYNYINSTRLSEFSDTTILDYLISKNAFLNTSRNPMPVRPLNELLGAVIPVNAAVPGGITGNDSNDLMVAYRKDSTKLEYNIPVEQTSLPPQARNLAFVVPIYADAGGLNIYKPLSLAFAGGI